MRISPLLLVVVLTACATSDDDVATTGSEPATTTTTDVAGTTTLLPGTTSTTTSDATVQDPAALTIETFPVPDGSDPHDVAPAADGGVWYTAQGSGELGWLDPASGETRHIALGAGSRPHGVIVGPDGVPWITDGGLNALVSVDPGTAEVTLHPLPDTSADVNLNTAVFDDHGVLWFTGQAGVYGSYEPSTGEMTVYEAPRGRGPYGITVTPDGVVYFASLAGSYVGEIAEDGGVTVLDPPTPDQGSRRVWSDSEGSIWVSEWNSGQVSRYEPATGEWATYPLPGDDPAAYAVFVDDQDIVWLSDFGSNSLVRFDPATETFTSLPLPHQPGEVRQIHGRPGEVWGAESGADSLVLIRTR
jgi:virginiamycin B lyase